jgi:hypothetical protein
MPIIAKDKGGKEYEPLPTGLHHSVCYGVVDIGTQPGGQYEPKRQIAVLWEVPSVRIDIERDGKKVNLPRGIMAIYTLSLGVKSKLRPMLESWRGRPFTEEELNGFDLQALVGANCFLNVVHKAGTGANAGRTFANVASVNPLPKGIAKLKPENPTIYFALDDCGPSITVPPTMSEWLKAKILQSEECQREARSRGEPERAGTQQPAASGDNLDEDVPF